MRSLLRRKKISDGKFQVPFELTALGNVLRKQKPYFYYVINCAYDSLQVFRGRSQGMECINIKQNYSAVITSFANALSRKSWNTAVASHRHAQI